MKFLPFFNLVLALNRGASFGLFNLADVAIVGGVGLLLVRGMKKQPT